MTGMSIDYQLPFFINMKFKQLIVSEKYNKRVLIGAVTGLSIVILFVVLWIGWIGINPVHMQPVEYNTYECDTESGVTEIFRLHALDGKSGRELSDLLCNNSQIRQRFGSVVVQWKHKNIEDEFLLHNRFYDLLVSPPSEIEQTPVGRLAGYEKIASYTSYDGYFVARKGLPKPVLDVNYWNKKKVGLIRDPGSRSGHITPLGMLRKSGIGDEVYKVTWFESHFDLRMALKDGDVDLIGSYWGEDDIEDYGDLPRMQISKQTPSSWYLLENEKIVKCAVWHSLKEVASNSSIKYFSDLKPEVECEEASQ